MITWLDTRIRPTMALLLIAATLGFGTPQSAGAQSSLPNFPTQATPRDATEPRMSTDRIIVKFKDRATAAQRAQVRR